MFASLKSKELALRILAFLNKQHRNIKFTIEYEENKKLPFLDTLVKRYSSQYETSVYHKKTFTGVYINWTSLTARKYKIGLIKGLLNRICGICSTQESRDLEIEKLKHVLWLNEYPAEVVNKTIESQLKKQSEIVSSCEKLKKFIVLPYVGPKSEEFGEKLQQLVGFSFPQVDFNVAVQSPATVGSFFPFKDKIKDVESQSQVIYKINCRSCDASYIGKTQRILYHRIHEHKNDNKSACYQHSLSNAGHEFDYENIEVIDKADNNTKLLVKELLHILKIKPSLNKQLNSQSDFDIKTIIVKAYQQFREEK